MSFYPKVVAFEANWTLFSGNIDSVCPVNPYCPSQINLERANGSDWVLRNSMDWNQCITMFPPVPQIIYEVICNGAKLAIVSRAKNKDAIDRALWFFLAVDPRVNQLRPIIDMVDFDEVVDEDKTNHLTRIQSWTGSDYADMILFDQDSANHLVQVELGVTFQVAQGGLTWDTYQGGLNTWRRLQAIRSPYRGQSLVSYAYPMFVGYAGMDEATIRLLTRGSHRVDLKESARWGYAMYIADDLRIAKYFADWIKRDAGFAGTQVCELWVRDAGKFLSMSKIWFPEQGSLMNDVHNQSQSQIGRSQEDRDMIAATWGAPAPYILFSRHFRMNDMPPEIPPGRWNEMVVYTQIQDALMLTIPLSDQDVNQKIWGGSNAMRFENMIRPWNIYVPAETWLDFRNNGETWIY